MSGRRRKVLQDLNRSLEAVGFGKAGRYASTTRLTLSAQYPG